MTENEINEYARRIAEAVDTCPICRYEGNPNRALEVAADVVRTQSRRLEPLPAYVWPDGHSPR